MPAAFYVNRAPEDGCYAPWQAVVFFFGVPMDNRKPFKTIDEQMSILRLRGMSIEESDRPLLMREGYYSIVNGYKDPAVRPA